jgi:hypothetical protein
VSSPRSRLPSDGRRDKGSRDSLPVDAQTPFRYRRGIEYDNDRTYLRLSLPRSRPFAPVARLRPSSRPLSRERAPGRERRVSRDGRPPTGRSLTRPRAPREGPPGSLTAGATSPVLAAPVASFPPASARLGKTLRESSNEPIAVIGRPLRSPAGRPTSSPPAIPPAVAIRESFQPAAGRGLTRERGVRRKPARAAQSLSVGRPWPRMSAPLCVCVLSE